MFFLFSFNTNDAHKTMMNDLIVTFIEQFDARLFVKRFLLPLRYPINIRFDTERTGTTQDSGDWIVLCNDRPSETKFILR